jgi:amino acid transporter
MSEAWTRKKPKRIVHNQWLIRLMIILCAALPIPLAGLAFEFAFIIPYMPLYLLIVWSIGAIIYLSLYVYSIIKKE